jgi:hypothetical protein
MKNIKVVLAHKIEHFFDFIYRKEVAAYIKHVTTPFKARSI